jgi:hypothetical protein
MEAHPGGIEAHSGAMEAHSGAMEAHFKTKRLTPKNFDATPGVP